MKKLLSALLVCTLFCGVLPCYSAAQGERPLVDASAFTLIEQSEGRTILSQNEKVRLPMASTTKIMTCIVVLEHCDITEEVTVFEEAVGTEGSSAYLRVNERLSVEDLLFCLMLQSANDAAVALAIHTAGSIEDFAYLMNDKAKRLGLKDTHFTNPHGLDNSEHYTTASDLAKLTSYALNNSHFSRIVSSKRHTVGKDDHTRTLTNDNKLLFSLDGCIGVKTGYTIRSGRCLVSACTIEDTTLVCVTLHCKNDWETHKRLFDYGFSSIKRFSYEGFHAELPVLGGSGTLFVSSDAYSFIEDPGSAVTFEPICPHFLCAPIYAGDTVGYLLVMLNGTAIDSLAITARQDAILPPSKSFLERIICGFLSIFK